MAKDKAQAVTLECTNQTERPDYGPDNCNITVVDDILTIRVDLRKCATDFGGQPRLTAKGLLSVATTRGFVRVGSETKVSMNVIGQKVADVD
jgi:hypothetical protein